jgi:hypothetical protein
MQIGQCHSYYDDDGDVDGAGGHDLPVDHTVLGRKFRLYSSAIGRPLLYN